ncbi:hypothetical protein PVK06_007737 [Gossypium arboreum]|uniref:Putative plant transposon protein domain-containing protein n=1 Tax=Gossypium arboreum TaxID=29729 RepID=A0ABR0QIV9_GOSAR|nr:hypothetical protein PVK06_007737 [Gossypium arboreum]
MVGTEWMTLRQDCYTVEMTSLKPKCRVWYHFLKSRILPSTHNSIVFMDQILLVHSIMQGRKINVGKIIFNKVHRCAQKDVKSLNFPSLITVLCQHINASVQTNEDVVPNRGAITRLIVVNISREDFP